MVIPLLTLRRSFISCWLTRNSRNRDECHEQVDGFPHNRYKWFQTIEEAQCFVGGVGVERAAAYWPRDRYEAVPRSITYGHGSAM